MHEKLLHYCAITELGSMLRSGETTPTGLTEHFIERIEKLNGPLTAFNLVTTERAMVEAEAMEAERESEAMEEAMEEETMEAEMEAEMDHNRRAAAMGYAPLRHLSVLTALMAEADSLRNPDAQVR